MNANPVVYDQYTHVTHSLRREARNRLVRAAWNWYDEAIEQTLGHEEIDLRFKMVALYEAYMTRDCTCLPDGDACKSCKNYHQLRELGLENYGTPVPWIE